MDLSYARVKEMEEIVKRFEEGGFGQFTDLEAPTRKDQYDFMSSFNKARHSVGFFPIYRADIVELQNALNCREDEASVIFSYFDASCECRARVFQIHLHNNALLSYQLTSRPLPPFASG